MQTSDEFFPTLWYKQMSNQFAFENLFESPAPRQISSGATYTVLSLNVQNPSSKRARNLLSAITATMPDIIVLNELRVKESTVSMLSEFRRLGFIATQIRADAEGSYHSVILSTLPFTELTVATEHLVDRVKIVSFEYEKELPPLYVAAVYGISWNEDNRARRSVFKQLLYQRIVDRLGSKSTAIIVGDLNIVEPAFHDHVRPMVDDDLADYQRFMSAGFVDVIRSRFPKEPTYTWYPPTGDIGLGQRLDHLFATHACLPRIGSLQILDGFRIEKLTDHSAILFKISL